jgi:hypothetical protein
MSNINMDEYDFEGAQGFVLIDIELMKENCKCFKFKYSHIKDKTPTQIQYEYLSL